MTDPKRIELSVKSERAILIKVIRDGEQHDEDPFLELEKLSTTAGANIVGYLTQKRLKIDPIYYIGKGKVNELATICSEAKANVIICDNDLNPTQVRNIEKVTDIKVIDRSELILDIFATHARTKQAKLQVELAQSEYMLPRLKHLWGHLERIEGGIGTRGPGEKQLEIDRRLAAKKIADLKKKLAKIEKSKQLELASRKDFIKVSLVGYTNAGKSTLMNALTDAGVIVEDKLFATLDTKTKTFYLSKGKQVLLSDTVGFIRKLPHHLVSSFNATLEETKHADILIHVIDFSSTYFMDQIVSVDRVLKKLKCDEKPTIMVLNKADAVNDLSPVAILRKKYPDCVTISAQTGEGLDKLRDMITSFLDRNSKDVELICNSAQGKLISKIFEMTNVLRKDFKEDKTHMILRVTQGQLNRLYKMRHEFPHADFKITENIEEKNE